MISGGHGSISQRAGMTVGNRAIFTNDGELSSGAIASSQPANPTGAAPANAAALTGTQTGVAVNFIASTAAGKVPFSVSAYVTGLIAGTTYWIDLA